VHEGLSLGVSRGKRSLAVKAVEVEKGKVWIDMKVHCQSERSIASQTSVNNHPNEAQAHARTLHSSKLHP
jgi:hypothetical protein